jgi:hypothetical protein
LESTEQLVRVFDEGSAKVRQALQDISDDAWKESWKLSCQDKPIFEGSRFLAYPQDVSQSPRASSRSTRSLPAPE